MAGNALTEKAVESTRFFRPIFLGVALLAASLSAAPGDQEIATLAEKLSRTLVSKGKAKVAVADFTDLEGRRTEFGRYLAEQLSVEMVNLPGMSVMDRANLKSILLEHKLSEDGITNPETAKKLGQFANVDAIVLGTSTSMDDGIVVTIKAVSTDTAEIIAATKGVLPRTKDAMQASTKGIGAEQESGQPKAPDSLPVATKDFGDLRVTMKTIRRAEISDPNNRWGPPKSGFRCVLEFTNRSLSSTALVAVNGQTNYPDRPRSRLTDNAGHEWTALELGGVGAVCVYGRNPPSEISETVTYGRHVDGPVAYYDSDKLWMGSFTSIPPNETIQVTFSFAPQRNDSRDSAGGAGLQFECELVTGSDIGRARSLRLFNLLWSNLAFSEGSHG